jgi:UDP-2,3-diacylglucosamine pyrophosphatase LpxH
LGFRGCSAERLLHFLHTIECDFLYLVGDIIDLLEMRKRLYWPQSHNEVVQAILAKAKQGTKVIYVPGNHDELLRDYCGRVIENVLVVHEAVHTNADGKRFLVLHGDKFDSVVRCSKALEILGSRLYGWLLQANRLVHFIRRKLGLPYWSLASCLKHRVKKAVQYISNFENAVSSETARLGLDGVVCGHIHRAEISRLNDITYCNCGDWVESCSALVEHHDGTLELLRWPDISLESTRPVMRTFELTPIEETRLTNKSIEEEPVQV